jgi:hypothetical protein
MNSENKSVENVTRKPENGWIVEGMHMKNKDDYDYRKAHSPPDAKVIEESSKLPLEIAIQNETRFYGIARLVFVNGIIQEYFFIKPLDEYSNDYLQCDLYSNSNYCEGKTLPTVAAMVSFVLKRMGTRLIAYDVNWVVNT